MSLQPASAALIGTILAFLPVAWMLARHSEDVLLASEYLMSVLMVLNQVIYFFHYLSIAES